MLFCGISRRINRGLIRARAPDEIKWVAVFGAHPPNWPHPLHVVCKFDTRHWSQRLARVVVTRFKRRGATFFCCWSVFSTIFPRTSWNYGWVGAVYDYDDCYYCRGTNLRGGKFAVEVRLGRSGIGPAVGCGAWNGPRQRRGIWWNEDLLEWLSFSPSGLITIIFWVGIKLNESWNSLFLFRKTSTEIFILFK